MHQGRPPATPRPSTARRRLPALLAVAAIVLVTLPAGATGLLSPGAPPAGSTSGAAASLAPASTNSGSTPGALRAATPAASPMPVAGATPVASPLTSPVTSPAPTPSPAAGPDVAVVPVTHFRSPWAVTGRRDLAAIVDDRPGRRYAALELVAADADAVLALLGLDRAALGRRLVLAADARALVTDLAAHRDRLAFLRADDVSPAVAALAWGDRALFGFQRVRSLADWPLTIAVPRGDGAPVAPAYDPSVAWTLFAAGDILLDRGVELAMRDSPRGAHFPFDGGTVDITGRCRDCSAFGWDLPYVRRTGHEGVVRARISAADVAIANFENPAPDRFRFHARGTVFSANPARIEGLASAGFDWVSIANNHIGDAGRAGILQTMANLDEAGVRHSGAGRNAREARAPAMLEVGGRTVALLAYDAIAAVYAAGRDTVGSAHLTASSLEADIARARDGGADVVIVFPHWGVEYDATPSAGQRRLARLAIDAGADMVIGNHAHWAAAMETYKGRPIWYALGNFVFDQTWSELTMEGITLELTFAGSRLVQARMQPHLILDRAQPNLLDAAGDGSFVLGQVFDASEGLLDW